MLQEVGGGTKHIMSPYFEKPHDRRPWLQCPTELHKIALAVGAPFAQTVPDLAATDELRHNARFEPIWRF